MLSHKVKFTVLKNRRILSMSLILVFVVKDVDGVKCSIIFWSVHMECSFSISG